MSVGAGGLLDKGSEIGFLLFLAFIAFLAIVAVVDPICTAIRAYRKRHSSPTEPPHGP